MVRAERSLDRERERRRKKELELARYTHNLSYKILTEEGKAQLGAELPENAVASFQRGSLENRDAYWQEQAGDLNFGQQMLEWLGAKDDTSGMSAWVAKQQGNEAIKGMLSEVGLCADKETIKQEFKTGRAGEVLKAMSADLVKAGEDPLTVEDLNENDARALIFYANYLNPADKKNLGKDAKQLINTLVGAASSESNGDISQTIDKLKQVAPLLRVAGEDGQHVLGALLVARAHALDSHDALSKIPSDAPLTDDEKEILEFLKKHTVEVKKEEVKVEPLELGKSYDVKEVFANLTPEPTPGHKYWIDHEVPSDFAKGLTPEQLRSLEFRKPMWIMEGNKPMLNREVFDPAYTLEQDPRFTNAELLTNKDSGLLALAAASAKTPEQQVALYKVLSDVIMRAHTEDPALLEDFLKAQTEESAMQFAGIEYGRAMPFMIEGGQQLNEKLRREFDQKFGKDLFAMETEPTAEEKQFLEERDQALSQNFSDFTQDILTNFANYQDRLLAIKVVPVKGQEQFNQVDIVMDIPATVSVWPERVKALQEALQKDPLTLTPEQMRQIEFLGHAVNTPHVMEMLKGTAQVGAPEEVLPPAPVGHEGEPVQEAVEKPATAMKMDEFFSYFDHLEEQSGLKRGQELSVLDSTHMERFPTVSEDVANFEVTDEHRNLAIYTLTEEEGVITPKYNTKDVFLGVLLRQGSLSELSFNELNANGFGQNMLLAYVLEAASTAPQQEALLRNVFSQIAQMYEEHPDFSESVRAYFEGIDEKVPNKQTLEAEDLFASHEGTLVRLHELTGKLEQNEEFTVQDFNDMGFFALPFNLKYISDRMQLTYESHQTSPVQEPQPQ